MPLVSGGDLSGSKFARSDKRTITFRPKVSAIIVLLAIATAAMALASIARVGDALSAHGGLNLLIGNNAGATGGYPTGFGPEPVELYGQHLSEGEADNLEFAVLFAKSEQPVWVKYGVYTACQLAYTALLTLFLARTVSLLQPVERPRGLQWTAHLVGLTVTSVTLLTFGQDRFRMPFLPWMAIEAAVAFLRLSGGTRQLDQLPRPRRGCRGPI